MKLKEEITALEDEITEEENTSKTLKLQITEMSALRDDLNLQLKGLKEKLILAEKNENQTIFHIRDLEETLDKSKRDLEYLKINNSFKMRVIQNAIEHDNNSKTQALNEISKKQLSEIEINRNLKERIQEIEDEINNYKQLIEDSVKTDSIRNKVIFKETDEMNKFLSEL